MFAILIVGILCLVGAIGVLVLPHGSNPPLTSQGGTSTPGVAEQLDQAWASAEHGGGPWGPVAARAPATVIHPAAPTGPNLTFGVVMTYDAADGYVLAVSLNATAGPYNNSYGPNDLTWKFAGGNWSEIATIGQVPATLSPGLAYDSGDGYVLLYGGRLMDTNASVAPLTNQTWSYAGGVWTNLSATSTPAPWSVDFANLVDDPSDGYILLYDEIGITPTNPAGFYNTTWTYAAGVWTNITSTAGTPPEMLGAMAYDAVDKYVVYFGGYTWTNQLSNSTWTFQGGTWTNISANVTGAPSPRMNFGITYDPHDGYVVIYGGLSQLYTYNSSAYSYEAWSYVGGNWTLLSSNGTVWSIQSMVYDVADNETILLGSDSNLGVPPNVVTWAFSAGGWKIAAPVFVRSHLVADVDHPFTLTVTRSVNEGGLQYAYSGLPSGCRSANTPTLNCTPSGVGTYTVNLSITGAAGFLAVASTIVEVNPAPTILGFFGTLATGEVGIATTVHVAADLGSGPLTYAYAGLPAACASTNSSVLRCVPDRPGSYNITAAVTDAIGVTVRSNDTLSVVPELAVSGLTPGRAVVDAGQLVTVTTSLSGGFGPFNYSYSGLPAGCGSMDSPELSCRPVATGSFLLAASASDSLGAIAGGTAALRVNALPSIVAFAPSSPRIAAGGAVSMSVTIAGGTSPFQYVYTGLPSGCGGSDGPTVSCPSAPSGNYTVELTVTDATGANASEATSFVVLPASSVVHPVAPGPVRELGFWWGFAVASVAIAAVAVVGGYRLVMARQGAEIVRKLRSAEEEPTVPSGAEGPTSPGAVGERGD